MLPSRSHYSLALGWSTGLVDTQRAIRGTHALTLVAEWWLARSLGVGVYGSLGALGTEMTSAISNEALATLRWRQFTDEVDRDAFTFSLGVGHAWREMTLGGDGAIARAAITRDVGWMVGESSGLVWSWELAMEQDLGALGYRTFTAGIRTGVERGIRAPKNLAELDTDPPFRSAISGDFRGGPQGLGFGAGLDVTFGAHVGWRTTAFWTSHDDGDGDSGMRANWGVETGPRVAITTDLLQPYVEAQSGPALFAGHELALLAEAEIGLGLPLFCQSRIDFGIRGQARVDHGFEPTAIFGVLRIAHGTALRSGSELECAAPAPIAR